tara:strand:- start:127 stop:558 length:432 start_codon:yes stop_codon:yes gene_type:complete
VGEGRLHLDHVVRVGGGVAHERPLEADAAGQRPGRGAAAWPDVAHDVVARQGLVEGPEGGTPAPHDAVHSQALGALKALDALEHARIGEGGDTLLGVLEQAEAVQGRLYAQDVTSVRRKRRSDDLLEAQMRGHGGKCSLGKYV